MAEGFRGGLCSGNSWWSNTTTTAAASPCSTAITDMGGGGGVNVSYGSSSTPWSSDQMAEINAIKALSSTSSQESDSMGGGGGGGGGASVLMDSTLQMMDFGLSCPTTDHWSQALLHERSSMDQVFNLEHHHHHQQQQQQQDHLSPSSSTTTNNSSSILRGLFEPSDQHHHHFQHQHQLAQPNYMNSSLPHQFLKTSPPKQQLHFTNNTPFWNPSAAMTNNINNTPPAGFFPSSPSTLQTQLFDEKPNCSNLTLKTNREEKKSNTGSTSTESTFKRPRIETPTPLPTFKVRKEKLGDRITALQQLVSPFGKTDTASVLFEAIEYIKFLHEQVGALSTPYMKSGSSHHIQYQQNSDKSRDGEGSKQDLRSRGLCLVPISSTFPVATETSADFWTPTYGGTYR